MLKLVFKKYRISLKLFFIDIKEIKADQWVGVKIEENPAEILLTFCHLCPNLRHKDKNVKDTRPSVSSVEAKSAAL